LRAFEINFFTGVPDSLLKNFCAYVEDHTKKEEHIICANERGAIAVSIGYHLATDKTPLVYLQNSGLGNIINPILSLADQEIYSIPLLLLIGWRGEPEEKDEPQHRKQGKVTLSILETIGIPYIVLGPNTPTIIENIRKGVLYAKENSASFAYVVRKKGFSEYQSTKKEKQQYSLNREEAIQQILKTLKSTDVVVSKTGMTSQEVFEYREANQQSHDNDFLTVGGMGHPSEIALGISIQKKLLKCFASMAMVRL